VRVYNFILSGTIEDIILDVLETKVNLFKLAIGQIDLILGIKFEDKNFDELIWKILVESENEKAMKDALNKKVGDEMAQGREKAKQIKAISTFLPDLDEE